MAYRTPQQRGQSIAQPPSIAAAPEEAPSPMMGVQSINGPTRRAMKVANGLGGIKETTKNVLTHPVNHLVIGTLTGITLGGALTNLSPRLKISHPAITIPLIVWGTVSVATTVFDMQR